MNPKDCKTLGPSSYSPAAIIVCILIFQIIYVSEDGKPNPETWIVTTTISVILFELLGVARHKNWLNKMNSHLLFLEEQRASLIKKINALEKKAAQGDTKLDKKITNLKKAANVPLKAVQYVGHVGGHLGIGFLRGFLGGGYNVPLPLETLHAGVEAIKTTGEAGDMLDTRLPSIRARELLKEKREFLAQFDEIISTAKISRNNRERWRANAARHTIRWCVFGIAAISPIPLISTSI